MQLQRGFGGAGMVVQSPLGMWESGWRVRRGSRLPWAHRSSDSPTYSRPLKPFSAAMRGSYVGFLRSVASVLCLFASSTYCTGQSQPLTTDQLRQLIEAGTPDRAIGIELWNRGLETPAPQELPTDLTRMRMGPITAAAFNELSQRRACADKTQDRSFESRDHKLRAQTDWCGTVTVFDSEKPPLRFKLHNRPITAVAFSEDDTKLISASQDSTVRLLDIKKGTSFLLDSPAHRWDARSRFQFSPTIACLAFLPGGPSCTWRFRIRNYRMVRRWHRRASPSRCRSLLDHRSRLDHHG
jgi:WD40 repeat protein